MTTPAGGGLRRRAREMALQLLFQSEFAMNGADYDSAQAKEMLRRFREDFDIGSEVADFGGELFIGVAERIKEIDAIIQAHSAHWKTSRMGLVDLSVMRISIFEMKFLGPATPPSVAINEAVEIAKTYGSTESGAFVNGILDHVARGL